jgi:pimeloyl-ACP methyl ester carboxylesterase
VPPEAEATDVATPAVTLRVLTWGAEDAPIALCLHGFPDTAYGWRKVAPLLVEAGYRVVAPYVRGYAPSSIPTDGSYHMGAVMDDALRVLDAVGPTGRDVIIGHDWGAYAANGLAAMPDSPFVKGRADGVATDPGVSSAARGGLQSNAASDPSRSGAEELVHRVLPIPAVTRAIREVDTAAVVAQVVAWLRRARRSERRH